MHYQPTNMTDWGADGLIARLEILRGKLAYEVNEDVRTFLILLLDDVTAEMRRQNKVRIEAIASAKLS